MVFVFESTITQNIDFQRISIYLLQIIYPLPVWKAESQKELIGLMIKTNLDFCYQPIRFEVVVNEYGYGLIILEQIT